jgi:hypothetical protein
MTTYVMPARVYEHLALFWLVDHNEIVDLAYARRLAFIKWLVKSGRLHD